MADINLLMPRVSLLFIVCNILIILSPQFVLFDEMPHMNNLRDKLRESHANSNKTPISI